MRFWSTEQQPQSQQFSYWREVICEAFVSLEPIVKQPDQTFIGQVHSRPLHQSEQTCVMSSAQFINRRWDEIRRNPVEYCFANFQLEGSCVVRQDGQQTLVSPGDFSIVDTTRPYYLDFRENWRVLSFRIPRNQLISRLVSPRQATARCVQGQTGLGLVASRFAHSLEQVNVDASSTAQDGLSVALNGILAIALGATLEAQEQDRLPVREAFRKAVEIYIADHLSDPLLEPEMIAGRFGVSRRTLYGLFEASPLSVSSLIREERLQASARELQNPSHASILNVALRWGFNDASHYSRLFKRRFGLSPRDFAAGKAATAESPASIT